MGVGALGSARGKEWEWTCHIAKHTDLRSAGHALDYSRKCRPGGEADLRSEKDGCVIEKRHDGVG